MMGLVMKALLFDVQGTATDFLSTVCGEAQRISAGRYPGVAWPMWYGVGVQAISLPGTAQGRKQGWVSVHSVYRDALDPVLDECGIEVLTDAERDELTLAWQQLRPWPDVLPGLIRLKGAFTLATLSNADVSAVVNISKRAGLPWDAIFAAEMAGVFKPDPAIYRMAATYLGLDPAEIMMVASHKYDIRARAHLDFARPSSRVRWNSASTATRMCTIRTSSTSTHLTSSTLPTNSAARASAVR